MFNGGGGVPVEQFHQFISTPSSSSTTTSSSSSAAAARIIIPPLIPIPIPNSSSNNNLIQTPPPPPPPIHSNSSSSSSNLNNNNNNNNSFLSFDHHPILFPPPLPTAQHHHRQNLFQPPNIQFLRPPTTLQHHHYNNITTTHHHHHHQHREISNNNNNKVINDEEMDIKDDSWSNDEVIQLLKIKSSIGSSDDQSWFDFTWDHVSRKLAEMGYKKSAEKCKDKFEEETCRSFGNTIGYNKNTTTSRYLITEELDDHLYNNNAHSQNPHHPLPIHESPDHNVIDHEQVPRVDEKEGEDGNLEPQGQKGHFDKDPPTEITVESTQDHEQVAKSKKRKRKHKKFKMVKGLCVELVNRMMAQQEEMHRKLLQDMAIRDEEKIKREEAWRKEEMERVQREIQLREQEQEMARNRQSTITEFLNRITSFDQKIQIPSDINLQDLHNIATNFDLSGTTETPSVEKFTGNRNQDHPTMKDDLGKRWPRDEVLALINIRSKVNNGIGGNSEEHQGYTGNDKGGGSLWERISQGMLEVGYKRSAKRCKEKWENINKYFRKTKDANKKRSLDSRTCPYYHELNKLYNQEKVASSSNSGRVSSDEPENCPMPTTTPEN